MRTTDVAPLGWRAGATWLLLPQQRRAPGTCKGGDSEEAQDPIMDASLARIGALGPSEHPSTGGDLLEAIRTGRLPAPPAATLLGIELLEVDDGRTTFGFVARPEIGNPLSAHGGILAAIADFAVSTAVWTRQRADDRIVTADLHVSFLRPIELDGAAYRCTGQVVHVGRTQANAVAEIRAGDGELRVQSMATCRILRGRQGASG